MTTTTLVPWLRQQFFDSFGEPLFLGTLTSFAAGTNTPLATYTDSTGATQNTNPLVLNPRGEGSAWIPPNVAYKFALADSFGNPIWTIDNVVNSQLITLYGGVDTGVSNAYLLNFAANFTAYTDGIIVYWIPANTNSTASTININGLGVINIVNPDGSNLTASEIIANQPAQILIKGGQALLITPVQQTQGTLSLPLTGFATTVTANLAWVRTGSKLSLMVTNSPLGTSNATSMTLVLPAQFRANREQFHLTIVEDAGTIQLGSYTYATNTFTFGVGASLGAFTSTGTKGLQPFTTIMLELGG